jgi:hypothetical protein
MNKYEQLIEYIINEDEAKAKALFHSIVVERSREIYESLMDEEGQAMVHDNQVGGLVDEIQADHVGMHEDDEELEDLPVDGEEGGDDFGGDMDGIPGEEHGEEGEGEIEDRVMDLEDAIDELRAEFDRMMGGDEGGEEMGDMGGDEHAPEAPMEPADESIHEATSGSGNPFAKSGSAKAGSAKSGASGKSGSGSAKSGSAGSGKKAPVSESERLREYTEKVKEFYKGENSEGHAVGAESGSVTGATNTKSLVAGKNDMGGTTANIVKGGSESAPDGKQYSGPKNEYSKGEGKFSNEQFKNAPGNKKVWDKKETSGHGAEKKSGGEGREAGDGGSVSVNKKSEIGGKVR